jgi:ABC-type multidrug transport system ATPase subunit
MIDIEKVSKRFGRLRALQDVSLTIERGERVGFVGANGSGKTTLLRAVVGLLRVEGCIRIDGIDVARAPERALAHVAYMPQIAPPLDAPISEVVRTEVALRRLAPATVTALAQRLGLALDAVATTRLRDLSGGTKQKLLAAMALAAAAPILICDEPTANLDAGARAAFFREVDLRPAGSILILCSHRVEEIQKYVDRVVELREGHLAVDRAVDGALALGEVA